MCPPLPDSSCLVSRLARRSGMDGVDSQYCYMRGAFLSVPWITKVSKLPMHLRERGPYLTAV